MDDTVTSVLPIFSICQVWASGMAIVPSAFTHMGTFVGIDTVTFSSYIVVADVALPVSPYNLAGTDMDAAEASADRISAMRKVALSPPPDILSHHESAHIAPISKLPCSLNYTNERDGYWYTRSVPQSSY